MSGTEASDETLRIGMLLEAAQTHQQLIEASLARLEAHTQGLDAVVRDEIRRTFVAECGSLVEEATKATDALQKLSRGASVRAAWWSVALVASAGGAMILVLARLLPSESELRTLRAERAQLSAEVSQLKEAGAGIDLRRCGKEQRLCVRIEQRAPAYGASADYFIVKDH